MDTLKALHCIDGMRFRNITKGNPKLRCSTAVLAPRVAIPLRSAPRLEWEYMNICLKHLIRTYYAHKIKTLDILILCSSRVEVFAVLSAHFYLRIKINFPLAQSFYTVTFNKMPIKAKCLFSGGAGFT